MTHRSITAMRPLLSAAVMIFPAGTLSSASRIRSRTSKFSDLGRSQGHDRLHHQEQALGHQPLSEALDQPQLLLALVEQLVLLVHHQIAVQSVLGFAAGAVRRGDRVIDVGPSATSISPIEPLTWNALSPI